MKKILFLIIVFLFTEAIADDLQYTFGNSEITPEEQAYLDENIIKVDKIEPNELAIARSLEEMIAKGESIPKTLGIPSNVDNSLLKYFPPIDTQGYLNSCAAFHAAYYYGTYRQAQDRDIDVRDGNRANCLSVAFIYNLMNGNLNRATTIPMSIVKLCEVGAPSWQTMPYNGSDYSAWPTEAAWVEALNNRMQTTCSIDASNTQGLNAVKQHLANGNIACTYFTIKATFYYNYPNECDGINNGVFYWQGDNSIGIHGATIVGYSDTKSYVDHRDGQTKYGAFLVANSWGTWWGIYNTTGTGTKGYYWVAYNMFLESTYGPIVYYNSDRFDYHPRLYSLTGINSPQRYYITHGGGIGSPSSPIFIGPDALHYERSEPADGVISDVDRVAVDLTDGITSLQKGASNTLFIKLKNSSLAAYNASVTSADFYVDLDGTGSYTILHSADTPFIISPNGTGYATVQLVLPPAKNIYVDDSNITGPWDGTSDHPYLTIQEGINAATFGDSVVVREGTYTGTGNKEIDPKGKYITIKSEKGAVHTIIDCEGAGRAFYIHTQETPQTIIDGFTITAGNDTSGNGGGGVFMWESSPVIRNCVIIGNASTTYGGGICARKFSEPVIFNCLIAENSAPEGGGIMAGNGNVTIQSCTITGNYAAIRGGGIYCYWGNNSTIINTTMWDDSSPTGAEIALGTDANPSTLNVSYSNIQGGQAGASLMDRCTLNWDASNLNSDPLFVTGPDGDYYLSQIPAGQSATSPCVDAGSATASSLGLGVRTTKTDLGIDESTVDLGYHYVANIHIYSIERAGSDITIRWNAGSGASYTVQWSEDMQSWHDINVGEVSEWTDTNSAGYEKKFYRIVE